jgi:hypothetical protein
VDMENICSTNLMWEVKSIFLEYQVYVNNLAYSGATDDRCANFSASTCPTQNLKLTASSTADKLPLEKFHRLLDLAFWGKFLKLDSISCFVFLWVVNRVSPGNHKKEK